jgi:hypothetical protein
MKAKLRTVFFFGSRIHVTEFRDNFPDWPSIFGRLPAASATGSQAKIKTSAITKRRLFTLQLYSTVLPLTRPAYLV